jgi:Undecaprenyl-phosphate galactose phosphotransferase WbaP
MNAATAARSPDRSKEGTARLAAERASAIVFLVSDSLSIVLGLALTALARGLLVDGQTWSQYFRLTPFLVVIPTLFALMDLYPGALADPVEELRRLTMAVGFGMCLLIVSTFFLKESIQYSRVLFVVALPVVVSLVVLGRYSVRRSFAGSPWWMIPTVLVGPKVDIDVLRHNLDLQPSAGIRVTGIVPTDIALSAIRRNDARCVEAVYALVVFPAEVSRDWMRRVEGSVWGCKKVIVVPPSTRFLWTRPTIRNCCGLMALEMKQGLLRRFSRFTKLFIDRALALIFVPPLVPVVCLIAITIKLTSKGPLFYSQWRIGENGRCFRLWKFRTMIANADQVLETWLSKDPDLRLEWQADRKLKSDPRVTPVGRFLRCTSLDELPQIWNVVRGDMSFVGPRPIVAAEVNRYGDEFDLYQKVKPGITGLWQVSGRNNTSYAERVAFDVHYIRNWSVWLDIYIMARTGKVVVHKRGAY